MGQARPHAAAHVIGGATVAGDGTVGEEGIHIGNGIIASAAHGIELCAYQPGQVHGVIALDLLIFAVEQQLLQGGEGQRTQAGYCRQDFSCAADPAEVKKVSS